MTLLFYWRIAFSGEILPSYDLFTYFYPYKAYVSASLRNGELPLWNPYIFMGVPGLANIQAAVFYPFNLLTVGLEPPQAVNLSILVHIFLAGAFMYAFSRVSLGLDRLSALVGSIVFMFSGFLSAQIGHINQLNASVWLPLLLLAFDRAYQRRSVAYAVLGSLVFAVQVLAGHPQEAFLSIVGLFIFALFRFWREWRQRYPEGRLLPSLLGSWREGLWAAAILLIIVLLGMGLIAFQLLPSAELSSHSIRAGGLKYEEAMSFSLPPWELPRSLLPAFSENPYSEFIAYVGILGLGLVALAFRARRHPYVPFCLALMVISLFLALGGFNPASSTLYRLLHPMLGLFRVPARWLFLYTFAAALAAGIGCNYLLTSAKERLEHASWRSALVGWAATCLVIALLLALLPPLISLPQPAVLLIWAILVPLSAALTWMGPLVAWRGRLALVVAIALIAELFFASTDLDMNHLAPSFAYTSLRSSITQLLTDPDRFRILSIASADYDVLETEELPQVLGYQPSKRQLNDLMSAAKYKEILAPNLSMVYRIPTMDGYDGGLLPLVRYLEFKQALLQSGIRDSKSSIDPGSPDALLRNQLAHIPGTRLLGALNVKYIIDDKRNDAWVDDTYYDLSTPMVLARDESLILRPTPAFEATALGLVTYLSGCNTIAQGEAVAEVSIVDSGGKVTRAPLRVGVDTAEGYYSSRQGVIAHQRARVAHALKHNAEVSGYHTKVKFDAPLYAKEIRITARPRAGRLYVVGASLIDERTMASESVAVNERLRLVHSGDVKIYENLDYLPRVFLVHRAEVVSGPKEILEAMLGGVQTYVVLSDYAGPVPDHAGSGAMLPGEGVETILYQGSRMVVKAKLTVPGFLVLSESFYPGWRATVDGSEVAILRANLLFKAIYLPAGEHTVEFRYSPASLALGMLISAISLVLAVVVLAIWRLTSHAPIL